MNSVLLRGAIILVLSMLLNVSLAQEGATYDWEGYKVWENRTQYSRTYEVNQGHPKASDDNPGTPDQPLKTINRAAQLVKAGERVLIHQGIYREMVKPKNSGTAPDQMISYESVPGDEVIIRGSRVLNLEWIQRRVLTDVLPDTSLTYTWSRRIWLASIPAEVFEEDYFPLRLANILPEEHQLMPWAKLTKDLAPYRSTRGLLFQNGKRLIQLDEYGDLARVPGSFWVDHNGVTIHIHTLNGDDPNNHFIELAVQSHLFRPQRVGLAYLQIRGLTFEHCANGFLRTSTGAVTAMGGHHWIIEDNKIRQVNSSGLEFGFFAFESRDPNPLNVQPREEENLGGMLVRNNRIHDCGTAGIRSYVVHKSIIGNNRIWNCGWQDAENYWECSGIKVLRATHTLIAGNHIHDIQGGNGIWVDWDNRYSRVTANIIHDIQTIQGGIFMEASGFPNLIDNNVIWNVDGNGIYGNESDSMIIAHNLVGNISGRLVTAQLTTGRSQGGRPLTVTKNRVFNNIFINGGAPVEFGDPDNQCNYNLYVTTREPDHIDLETQQKTGWDKNSWAMSAHVEFQKEVLSLTWSSQKEISLVPSLSEVKTDLHGQNRDPQKTVPGPFNYFGSSFRKLLLEMK